MTWLALSAAIWSVSTLSCLADSGGLQTTAAERARAETLVAQLGDDLYRVREQATSELYKMGRPALAVVEDTLAKTTDPEVRARCEWLLPRILAADLKARLDAFLADADGKGQHDLPGWNELVEITGSSTTARELFVEMVKVPENADLFAGMQSRDTFASRLIARRAELYARLYRTTPNGQRDPPTGPEVAALILAEYVNTTPLSDRRYQYAAFSSLNQPPIREFLNSSGKGEVFRQLVARWLMTRTDAYEQNSAMSVASNLNLKEAPPYELALRVLARDAKEDAKNGVQTTAYTKAQALGLIARTEDAKHLPVFTKLFTDNAAFVQWRNVNGQNLQMQVQVKDTALALALVLTKQDPKDYFFEVMNTAAGSKFSYFNYSFSTDENRKLAFIKWSFWEAQQARKAK